MATYKIIGTRFLRQYTEEEPSPVYAANVEAEEIVSSFCNIPWKQSQVKKAQMTYHTDDVVDDKGTTGFNKNAEIRESFDAAMWCGEHSGGKHRAYANAAVYRWTLPDAADDATISAIKLHVTSDPYNSSGVRLHLFTSATPDIPTSCRTLRGEDASGDIIEDGTTEAAVAPRTTRTIDNKEYWYPTGIDVTITPTNGLTAQKYLFLFVGLEDYSVVRGNWIEGSSFIDNLVELTTSADVSGWTAGETYDLSAPPEYDHTYNVAVDGVYPCVLEGNSGVKTLTLQRNGEELRKEYESGEIITRGVLSVLTGGALSTFLEIPSEKITCMRQIYFRYSGGESATYLVIGGTFDDGTFDEIPGLLLFDLTSSTFVPKQSLVAQAEDGAGSVPLELTRFAKHHGGFADVGIAYFGTDGDLGAAFVCIAMDGTTFCDTNSQHRGGDWAPAMMLKKVGNRFRLAKWRGDETIVTTNMFDFLSLSRGGKISFSVAGYGDKTGGESVPWTSFVVFAADNTKINHCIYYMKGSSIEYSNNNWILFGYDGVWSKWTDGVPYTGTINNLCACCNLCYIGGSLSEWNSGDVDSTKILCMGVSWDSWNDRTGAISNMSRALYTGAFPNFSPDNFTNLRLFRVADINTGVDAQHPNLLMSGDFTSIDSSTPPKGRLVLLSNFDNNLGYTTADAIALPNDAMPSPSVAVYRTAEQDVLLAVPPSSTSSYQYYTHLHPSISISQGAFGLRTLFASLYRNALAEVPLDSIITATSGVRPGAMFTVRGDTLEDVPTGASTDIDVPTWQLTVSNLSIPFALPTAWRARKLRLSWGTLPTFTTGSKINAWIKPEYLSDNPQIDDVAIYDASKDEVDGWRRLGTFSPDATMTGITGYAVEFDLDVVNTNNEIGRMATLLLTAYINLDDVNPASGSGDSGDTPALPQGVGTVSVNPVTGTITGINTGFKPDITLLG